MFGGSDRLKEPLRYFEMVVLLKPIDPDAINNLGITIKKLGKLHETVVQFTCVLELKPEFAEAANNLGLTFEKLREFSKPRRFFEKVTQLDNSYA